MTTARINDVRLTRGQQAVLDVLKLYGPLPDHALVPLAQHVTQVHQTSSSIRSRRAELTARGLVRKSDTVRMPSGRSAGIFEVV